MIASPFVLALIFAVDVAPEDAPEGDAEPADSEPGDDAPSEPRDAGPSEPRSSTLSDPLPPSERPDSTTTDASTTTSTQGDKPVPSQAAIERDGPEGLEGGKRKRGKLQRTGTPQRFEAEIKFGPYLPDVDRLYDGPGLGPYATIFGRTDSEGNATGQPRQGVMPALGFEWQFVYLAGPLGLGTQLAFFRDKAKALLAQPNSGENVRSEADSTRFGMVPVSLFLAYRFEYLADRFRWIPIVPYAKAGVGYAFWWTKDGNGDVSENSMGQKGRGGVLGWHMNFGGMLRLDFIEPGVAKKLDKTTGINHTYVFGEFQVARYNNFGVGNSISIGDNTYFLGLAIEF